MNDIKIINSPEDLDNIKSGDVLKYKCVKCGKYQIIKFARLYSIHIYKKMLCKQCSMELTHLERYGENYSPVKPSINIDDIREIFSPEEIDTLKRDEYFKYRCHYPNCNNLNVVKFPGHHRKDRVEKLKRLLCKDCSQRLSKMESLKRLEDRKNIIEVKTVEDIERLPRNTWFRFVCKGCGKESVACYQGKSRMYLHSRFLCTKCSFNSTFDPNKMIESRVSNFGTPSVVYKYRYFDYSKFDSGWEFCLWVYAINHGEEIEREPVVFEYEFDGETHKYSPDFRYKGKLIEIKGPQYFLNGDPKQRMIFPYTRLHSDSELLTEEEKKYMDDLYEAKHQCGLSNGVEFWSKEECLPYVEYVENIYGKDYISKFKINTEK